MPSITDKFNQATTTTRPSPATLTAIKVIGATSITVDQTTGWPVDTAVHFVIYEVDANNERVAGTQCDFKGIVNSATTINNVTLKAGTDREYSISAKVICTPTAAWGDELVEGILEHANQDGSLREDAVRTALNLGNESTNGWEVLAYAPNTVTNNGNRSYDLVFNSTDLTDTVSEGMRLRTTRTVSAPTQCADLERDSSQYFSKTSPAGLSFTTTFTCSAWVKLESYGAIGGIIARMNGTTEGWGLSVEADGRVTLLGRRTIANNKALQSYQSIPLNKWVHVAACMDMTAGDTSAQKIWIDGVEVPRAYILTGTATAIVQGTTALVVGAKVSAGTDPFDGKIAQASVHSACLSDAQVKALMTQTISSSSPSLVSGFTLSNTLADVSANANDLTASGSAVATNVDSPFGSYLGGTLDYGIITKTAFSTNTTLTVQVPEGCTIPTSGGVSAVAYSTQAVPYLFPRDSGRWEIAHYSASTSTSTSTTFSNTQGAFIQVEVPSGAWELSYNVLMDVSRTTQTAVSSTGAISTATSDSGIYLETIAYSSDGYSTAGTVRVGDVLSGNTTKNYTTQTPIYFIAQSVATSGGVAATSGKINYLKAIPAYL